MSSVAACLCAIQQLHHPASTNRMLNSNGSNNPNKPLTRWPSVGLNPYARQGSVHYPWSFAIELNPYARQGKYLGSADFVYTHAVHSFFFWQERAVVQQQSNPEATALIILSPSSGRHSSPRSNSNTC
eukprot:1160610-Pelagomonas_calceolata.AAC.12